MSEANGYPVIGVIGGKGSSPDNKLQDIARKVQRLSPDHRDPERYFMEKSEIVAALRSIAREVRRG